MDRQIAPNRLILAVIRLSPTFSAILAIAGALAVSGCGPVHQPDSIKQVAAVEVPLRTAADRADLVVMLRRRAGSESFHVDDMSDQWRKFEAQSNTVAPQKRGTIFVGVWRGATDDDLEADVGDSGHPGRAWVTFLKGRNPERSTEFRKGLLGDIYRHWPETRDIPMMPSGALPLVSDLIWTGKSYVVKAERIAAYSKSAGDDPR